MSLRIACDLDGTLADMDAALQQEAKRLFGPEVDLHAAPVARLKSAEDVETELAAESDGPEEQVPLAAAGDGVRPVTRSELRRLWAHVGQVEDFWTSLDEIEPGAVQQLAASTERNRWEVLFLTQRPPSKGAPAQLQSQRWLQAHGFAFPSVFVMSGSRGKVADALALDAVIDDRPENCLDVATDSTAKPLLIWRPHPDLLPAGVARTRIETVYSMAEAIARLEVLMAERSRRRTLLRRVRDVIGL
jgi:hypothetical protein